MSLVVTGRCLGASFLRSVTPFPRFSLTFGVGELPFGKRKSPGADFKSPVGERKFPLGVWESQTPVGSFLLARGSYQTKKPSYPASKGSRNPARGSSPAQVQAIANKIDELLTAVSGVKKKNPCCSHNAGCLKLKVGADGGGRTHTPFRIQDFESSASANSATSATKAREYIFSWARSKSILLREKFQPGGAASICWKSSRPVPRLLLKFPRA